MRFLRRFSSSDRDAAIVVALVIVVSIVLFPFLSEQDSGFRSNEELGVRNEELGVRNEELGVGRRQQGGHSSLFKFDPNTASEAQLLSLGLAQWQVRNILKYRFRGGRYRVKEDFARLYGLSLEKYRQLEPYITIAPEVMAADVVKRERDNRSIQNIQNNQKKDSSTSEAANPITPLLPLGRSGGGHSSLKKLRYGETVDINTADTAMLKQIPGIGSYYAMRIVELRNRRQMFSSPEDLLAIRDFPETALGYMTASQNFPPIFVNLWSQKQLSAHPLLNYTQARDIITLRRLSGSITAPSDIAALPSFDAKTIERITPLLRFDE